MSRRSKDSLAKKARSKSENQRNRIKNHVEAMRTWRKLRYIFDTIQKEAEAERLRKLPIQ